MQITSQYAGRCRICGGTIQIGDRVEWSKGISGVRCLDCAGAVPTAPRVSFPQVVAVALPAARRISAQGVVTMPYDPAAITLLRALPGARWNPSQKAWSASVSDGDLPRTLEIARKLSLQIDPALLAREATLAGAAAAQASAAAQGAGSVQGLYPFQVAGVQFFQQRAGGLLGDQMGLGKTVQTLAALPRDGTAAVLVVCPAVVKHNWRIEAKKWAPQYLTTILGGRHSFRWPQAGEIAIINWDILPAVLKAAGYGSDGAWRNAEMDCPPAPRGVVLIADEVHYAKSNKAARSKKLAGLVQMVRAAGGKAFGLTGTPLANKPFDLWGVLCTLGIAREFASWQKFLTMFGARQDQWGGWSFSEPNAECAERLRRVMLRRLREDVLPDLPRKQHSEILCECPKGLAKDLDALWKKHQKQIESGAMPPFEAFSALRAELAEARVPNLVAVIEEYEESDTPVVVFSAHRIPVESIGSRPGWAMITGDTSPEARQEIVERFQYGQLKGVALTIAAGGVGITLTKASHVVFCDLGWNPSDNSQAEDRCCRIGQTAQSVQITVLVTDHPMDRHVTALLGAKASMIDAAIEAEAAVPELPEPAPMAATTSERPATTLDGDVPPAGGYAVVGNDGSLDFYRLRAHGDWMYLCIQAGPSLIMLGAVSVAGEVRGKEPLAVRTIIQKLQADPLGAAQRYGRELGRCACCGLPLTNEESRSFGIGPDCRAKYA